MGKGAVLDDNLLSEAVPAQIFARMLRNLRQIHSGRGDFERAVSAGERITWLQPETVSDLRDLGYLHCRLGAFHRALSCLDEYLRRVTRSGRRRNDRQRHRPAAVAARGVELTGLPGLGGAHGGHPAGPKPMTGREKTPPVDPGLCGNCRHCRVVASARNARFFLCRVAERDPRFPKYPRLPVVACEAFQRGGD